MFIKPTAQIFQKARSVKLVDFVISKEIEIGLRQMQIDNIPIQLFGGDITVWPLWLHLVHRKRLSGRSK